MPEHGHTRERREQEGTTQASARSSAVSRSTPVQGVGNAAMRRLMTTPLGLHLQDAMSASNAAVMRLVEDARTGSMEQALPTTFLAALDRSSPGQSLPENLRTKAPVQAKLPVGQPKDRLVERENVPTGCEGLVVAARMPPPLQRAGAPASSGASDADRVHQAAELGISGAGGPLPHLEAIQQSFGNHNVSRIVAHTDDKAAHGSKAMGAEAFTIGDHVAFAGPPSLHTAAHEAAHAIQQRAGVHLAGGVGEVGDRYEQHADAVADLVVGGSSAEPLLTQRAQPLEEQHLVGTRSSPTPSPGQLLQPQSTTGNRAVNHLLRSRTVPATPPTVIQRQGLPKRRGVDKYATMAGQLRIWLHSSTPSSYEIKIAGQLSRLTRAEVTRVENAYGQPRYEPDEAKRAEAGPEATAINPYQLREDVRTFLPNGEKLAQWIESHSDLPRKVTAAEAERALEKEFAKSAGEIFPESARRTLLQKLADPGKLSLSVWHLKEDIPGHEKVALNYVLWGKWVATHFDYLYKNSLVSESAVIRDLAQPDGDLLMVAHVRTDVLDRWIRLNRAVQPTAVGGVAKTPLERKAMGIVARQSMPGIRAYRKIWADTPSELSTIMLNTIDSTLHRLEYWDKDWPRAESGQ